MPNIWKSFRLLFTFFLPSNSKPVLYNFLAWDFFILVALHYDWNIYSETMNDIIHFYKVQNNELNICKIV